MARHRHAPPPLGPFDVRRLADRALAAHDRYAQAAIEGECRRFAVFAPSAALADLVDGQESLCATYGTLTTRLNESIEEVGPCGSGYVTIR